MSGLFALLVVLSPVALVAGLIRPSWVLPWGKTKTRGRAALTYGISTVVFLVLFGLTAPEPATQTATNPSPQKTKPVEPISPPPKANSSIQTSNTKVAEQKAEDVMPTPTTPAFPAPKASPTSAPAVIAKTSPVTQPTPTKTEKFQDEVVRSISNWSAKSIARNDNPEELLQKGQEACKVLEAGISPKEFAEYTAQQVEPNIRGVTQSYTEGVANAAKFHLCFR